MRRSQKPAAVAWFSIRRNRPSRGLGVRSGTAAARAGFGEPGDKVPAVRTRAEVDGRHLVAPRIGCFSHASVPPDRPARYRLQEYCRGGPARTGPILLSPKNPARRSLDSERPSFLLHPLAHKDFSGLGPGRRLAATLHCPRAGWRFTCTKDWMSRQAGTALTARCFGCRNRFGFVNLIVLDSGVLCCRRCWRSRDILEAPGRKGAVETRGMSASDSRFVAIWASHEARARLWFRLFVLTAAGLVLSLVTTIRVWNQAPGGHPDRLRRHPAGGDARQRRLLRAERAGDPGLRHGVRRLLRPQRLVLRSSTTWSGAPTGWRRSCASASSAPSAERPRRPGVVTVIEKLQRRTQIDPATLDIQVDKRPYPWKVKVKGVRQVVGDPAPGEAFELELDLVRASREERLEGLLVWGIRAKGDPIDTVLAAVGTEGGRIP